jgi:ADP-ribosylglycohydrolase
MTIAVAEAFLTAGLDASEEALRQQLVKSMRRYGKQYPGAGYGLRFWKWLHSWRPKPYNSCGNGSAMRVSSVAWLYNELDSVRRAARISSEVTHNHPEGIRGAEATAAVIFLARTGHSKDAIKEYVIREFGYDLSRTCDEIRPGYHHTELCQETVPEAITAFLEGESFEDVIRTAVSLGGDCDTVAAIAGSMAEGFYGVPENLKKTCRDRLPKELLAVLDAFEKQIILTA